MRFDDSTLERFAKLRVKLGNSAAAAQQLGHYTSKSAAKVGGFRLARKLKKHPRRKQWERQAQRELRARSVVVADHSQNPLEAARAEAAAAAFSASNLVRPEKHDGEFWRRLDLAQKLGVPLHEVGELPAGPPQRWDMRVDRLDPYRPDAGRRIPTQRTVDRIMAGASGRSLMSTYASKPAPRRRPGPWIY